MTRARANAAIQGKLARALNVRAEALRSEIYGTLERNRIGAGSPSDPQASAPRDPPARRTGRLMESIAVTKRASTTSLSSEVAPREQAFRTATAYYPFFLEFGTRHMAPRPFMRPSLATFKQKVRAGMPIRMVAD